MKRTAVFQVNVAPNGARKRPTLARRDFAFVRTWLGSRAGIRLVRALIALAVVIRVASYLLNPSFSVDEADLALNLMHRSYLGLFSRLDFNQAAPAGFLILQKLVVGLLGPTPFALRLVPVAAGVASSFLIFPVAKRFIGRAAAFVALALFAVSAPLVFYASTNKQYSVDVAVSLALYATVLVLPDRPRRRFALILAVAGIVSVWLSHPAVFVLAGIGTTLILKYARARRWSDVVTLVAVCVAWIASSTTAYLLTRASVSQIQHSIATSGTLSVLGSDRQPGVLQTYGGIARYLIGIPMLGHGARSIVAVMALLLAFGGLVGIVRSRLFDAAILILPVVFAVIATALDLYPRYSRTFLFVAPTLLILVAGGAYTFVVATRRRFVRSAAVTALAILLGLTAYGAIDQLQSTRKTEPLNALRRLAQAARPGDSLYLYLTSQYTFRYYLECGCFANPRLVRKARRLWPSRPTSDYPQFAPALKSAPPRLIVGDSTSRTSSSYEREFKPLRGRRRVWVLVVDPSPEGKQGVQTFLSRAGTLRQSFPPGARTAPAYLWLYDLVVR